MRTPPTPATPSPVATSPVSRTRSGSCGGSPGRPPTSSPTRSARHLDQRPAGEAEPAPYPLLLWQLTKALGFAAPDPVPDTETFEATADAADDAAAASRRLQAAGRSPLEATGRAEDRAILWMEDVGSISGLQLAYAPADYDQTLRTLTVRIAVVPGQPLVEVLGADRGAAPAARAATAADVLEVAAAVERITAVVARLTVEPPADGVPVLAAGTGDATVVCELCGRTVPAAVGRRVAVGPGSRPAIT